MIKKIQSVFNIDNKNEWSPDGTKKSIKPFRTDTLNGNYVVFPYMVQIEIEEMNSEFFGGEESVKNDPVFGVSFRMFTEEDLAKSKVILLRTALCSRSLDEIGDMSICYAIDLFGEHLLYPKLLLNRLDNKTYPVDISTLILQIIGTRGE